MMILEIERLTKSFGGLVALNAVTFHIEEGEILGLIGPNGSGKSTVFNVVTGIYRASAGSIRFCGEDINAIPTHDIARRGIARTFQLVKPFLHLSVLQNVMAGRLFGHDSSAGRIQAEDEARELLSFIDLADKHHLQARALTVMERKRLDLARALATRPKLLLLDEFMAGLTPSEVQDTMKLITTLRDRGMTIVVVEHIVRAIMNLCSRVVVLNAGQKIADGTPGAVAKVPAVITAYLGKSYAGD